MIRFSLIILIVLFSSVGFTKEIEVNVNDCGPLDRGKFGVVFTTSTDGKGDVYFSEGKANSICPKIIKAKKVKGTASSYCNHVSKIEPECKKIKVFSFSVVGNE